MANFLLGNSHIHECIFVDRPNKYKYGAEEKEGDIDRSLVGGPKTHLCSIFEAYQAHIWLKLHLYHKEVPQKCSNYCD